MRLPKLWRKSPPPNEAGANCLWVIHPLSQAMGEVVTWLGSQEKVQ